MIDLKFDEKGLIPAIIQDATSGQVLMMAYMDLESLKETLKDGQTVFYSRSRKKSWRKGEKSGHTQDLVEILTDCDRDTLLIRVKQKGGACHLGYRSCFVHKLGSDGEIKEITQAKVFDPEKVYRT